VKSILPFRLHSISPPWRDFGLYSTYGWHPRAVAVALANLRYLTRHRNKLLKNATQLGQYFLTRPSQMGVKGKATIRGKGFAIGIEVKDENYASEVADNCRENGLLVSAEEDFVMLFPALNISRATRTRHYRKVPLAHMKSASARPFQGGRKVVTGHVLKPGAVSRCQQGSKSQPDSHLLPRQAPNRPASGRLVGMRSVNAN
jgi:hypothetical protein